jgi:hypothetical protein
LGVLTWNCFKTPMAIRGQSVKLIQVWRWGERSEMAVVKLLRFDRSCEFSTNRWPIAASLIRRPFEQAIQACARSWRKERISQSPTTDKMIVTTGIYAVQKIDKNIECPPHHEC